MHDTLAETHGKRVNPYGSAPASKQNNKNTSRTAHGTQQVHDTNTRRDTGQTHEKHNKPRVQYKDTLWIPAAQWNNRYWACPNISSRPEQDSARQKDGQEKRSATTSRVCGVRAGQYKDTKMGKAMASNDIAFLWHTRSLCLLWDDLHSNQKYSQKWVGA